MRRNIVAVIGNKTIEKDGIKYRLAYETGKLLVDNGFRVQTGGLDGVMCAVMEGAKASENYREGDTVALLPFFDVNRANEFADIVIPTGLDVMRNAIVANADAVIGIGGGAGTLCEYSFAWSMKRLVIAYKNSGGWSEKLADTVLDEYGRYSEIPDDRIYGAETPEEAVGLIKKLLPLYGKRHEGIAK